MYKVVAFYKFQNIDPLEIKKALEPFLENIKGTVILANEGINGTVSGTEEDIIKYAQQLEILFPGASIKFSYADKSPFYRLKIKLKKEIVTLRALEADPSKHVGEYIEPKDWNQLISDPEVICIDTRNDYEIKMGTFKGAIDPKTRCFVEFKDYVEKELKGKENQKIAMWCTGGIRCEKASAYLLSHGFKHVYHLKGGILKYLEETPKEKSLWEGECFVFDQRVGIEHQLSLGNFKMCFGCRMPLSQEDLKSLQYEYKHQDCRLR